jgi:N-acyl-D-amino-acid deacylase
MVDVDAFIEQATRITDKATYVNPHQHPVGIKYVIVNGKLVISNGRHTRRLSGKALYSQVCKQV